MQMIFCFYYTDGVSETMDSYKALFGDDRIKSIIKSNADKTPEQIKQTLLYYINNFKGTAPIADDMAFIILKCLNA